MQAYLNTAIKAARKAGDIAQINFDRIESKDVRTKSYNEFATHVDEQAERAIIEIIRSRYPEHSILGEEHGMQDNDSEFIWIIDPIDGTTNYIHGFPVYCVSIALKIKDRLEVGVIYDPSRQELFTAIRGMGSQLDGRKIRVSKQSKLEGSLLGTGFPYRNDEECLKVYLEMFSDFAKVVGAIRRPGSAALDLAYVASGRYDGFWEFSLKPWDVAAGALLIQEAGGIVQNIIPNTDPVESGSLFCGNPKIFELMQEIIKRYDEKLKAFA
tara:strand:- start:1888 stop:2694 length:807 start_codon:yes stop_codon:yes gene_type:complete